MAAVVAAGSLTACGVVPLAPPTSLEVTAVVQGDSNAEGGISVGEHEHTLGSELPEIAADQFVRVDAAVHNPTSEVITGAEVWFTTDTDVVAESIHVDGEEAEKQLLHPDRATDPMAVGVLSEESEPRSGRTRLTLGDLEPGDQQLVQLSAYVDVSTTDRGQPDRQEVTVHANAPELAPDRATTSWRTIGMDDLPDDSGPVQHQELLREREQNDALEAMVEGTLPGEIEVEAHSHWQPPDATHHLLGFRARVTLGDGSLESAPVAPEHLWLLINEEPDDAWAGDGSDDPPAAMPAEVIDGYWMIPARPFEEERAPGSAEATPTTSVPDDAVVAAGDRYPTEGEARITFVVPSTVCEDSSCSVLGLLWWIPGWVAPVAYENDVFPEGGRVTSADL